MTITAQTRHQQTTVHTGQVTKQGWTKSHPYCHTFELLKNSLEITEKLLFFPVALQPYRALSDRAAAAGHRS
jgi:hypothetical protein